MQPEDMQTEETRPAPGRTRGWAKPAAFAAAGLVVGGVLAGSLSASADDSPGSATTGAGTSAKAGEAPGTPPEGGAVDESQPQRSDEELLTGDTASKVEAAALAAYPGATVLRLETDSDGVYEAHLVAADGSRVTVEVGEDFVVTGTEQGGGPGGGHGGGPGRSDDGAGTPGADPEASSST